MPEEDEDALLLKDQEARTSPVEYSAIAMPVTGRAALKATWYSVPEGTAEKVFPAGIFSSAKMGAALLIPAAIRNTLTYLPDNLTGITNGG